MVHQGFPFAQFPVDPLLEPGGLKVSLQLPEPFIHRLPQRQLGLVAKPAQQLGLDAHRDALLGHAYSESCTSLILCSGNASPSEIGVLPRLSPGGVPARR